MIFNHFLDVLAVQNSVYIDPLQTIGYFFDQHRVCNPFHISNNDPGLRIMTDIPRLHFEMGRFNFPPKHGRIVANRFHESFPGPSDDGFRTWFFDGPLLPFCQSEGKSLG